MLFSHRGGTDGAAAAEGMSTSYLTQGGGKLSVTLDLESEEGLAKLHQLLARADVFVEITHQGPCTVWVLMRKTAARHPHLIICAMTGYGRGGPQENSTAYDVNIQAQAGLWMPLAAQLKAALSANRCANYGLCHWLISGLCHICRFVPAHSNRQRQLC